MDWLLEATLNSSKWTGEEGKELKVNLLLSSLQHLSLSLEVVQPKPTTGQAPPGEALQGGSSHEEQEWVFLSRRRGRK